MKRSAVSENIEPGDNLKTYSCLTCRQRKVKCDRCTPCSNCIKAEKQCSFIPPVRGKRKRTKPPRESLHAKLKRYEELLKSYGAKFEPSGDFDDSESETASQPDDVQMDEEAVPPSQRPNLGETKPRLIIDKGTSRYFDSAPWSSLGNGLHHPEVGEPIDESNIQDNELFFEPEQFDKPDNLANLHLSHQMLSKLKEIYLDRVDPMIKILHVPTFWISATDGLSDPQSMPTDLEAMIFAFYLATISTLKEDESQHLFGVRKSVMYSRYRLAARQALINAGFLSTSSPTTLGAYALFMTCIRKSYKCDTLFVLSGVAIRLARKMGLHRDSSTLGLSPFETEMRRRLWWHLAYVDFRLADVLGTKPSLDLSCSDNQMPLNVEDEDLHPDMVNPPLGRRGITTTTPCLVKYEIMGSLREFPTSCPSEWRWEALSSPDVTIMKKDNIISHIEDRLEVKYLRYCDPSNSLHTFVSIIIRSSICKMKLFAHNPRQFANDPIKVPQSERNIFFANAMKLLEYVIFMQEGTHGLEKYKWNFGTSVLWNVILYVLIEVRHRKTGTDVDKAWRLIETVFSYYPQVFDESPGPVYIALGKWTLEVWDDHVAALKADGLPEPLTPDYINAIGHSRRPAIESPFKAKIQAVAPEPATRETMDQDRIQSLNHEDNHFDGGALDFYDLPNLLSFEMDPNEWIQWEQLVAEQGSFAQGDSM
ncbi:fungal-specific transcription factor domain-containing protein [Aspergillus caelatus]|uniref:Fungal-specific transcription factor domain-containing protein n=2 Tax=Aspergillus subgen. Circumdati TaxID=2720871 RepID=A0A5N6ZPF4_9EURO|nr:fungal-specific transcription factor domain-containing protein [Aspergillus caelatus]KAE8359502.1 fungal-specific transcription factor domain-containing protein [Aspergillus caelatus]KAE8411204.1 fungal-specific transcription factor domain-containing protein [Aspergillus pseudocaelatus]